MVENQTDIAHNHDENASFWVQSGLSRCDMLPSNSSGPMETDELLGSISQRDMLPSNSSGPMETAGEHH